VSEIDRKQLYNAALGLLARREHACQELKVKLLRKFSNKGEIPPLLLDTVLEDLQNEQYLCDTRFTESYVNYRKRNGKGPMRITQELREKGVSDELIGDYVIPDDEVWEQLACELSERRFGRDEGFEDVESRQKFEAKQMRFLQGRGFTFDQIKKAVRR
jgi:regulatory protein